MDTTTFKPRYERTFGQEGMYTVFLGMATLGFVRKDSVGEWQAGFTPSEMRGMRFKRRHDAAYSMLIVHPDPKRILALAGVR